MPDIVERLRRFKTGCDKPECERMIFTPLVCDEAADEIERLRAALRFYAGWPQGPEGNIAPLLLDSGAIARAALEGK